MNRLLLFLFLIAIRYTACGQLYGEIRANNIKASFEAGGLFFAADSGYYGFTGGHYEVPIGSGIYTILSSTPWLTGLNQNNDRVGGLNYYNPNANLYFGPVATSRNAVYDSTYNKVFKVTHAEILAHIIHHADAGYLLPVDIAQWPGNGNVFNGEALTLAPFIDLNGNHIYEPALGEYPDIYGDDAIFMILSDSTGTNVNSCNHMNSEIHVLAYSFQVPPDSILYNATFLHFTIFNRSVDTYHDVRFSSFIDADVGCAYNDRIGCDTLLNSFFAYNDPNIADNRSACYPHQLGYGLQKVVQGATFLNHKLTSFGSASGAGVIEFEPACSIIRNWQVGKWADGTHITYGGNGYSNSNINIDFLYPGDPADSTQWSELHQQIGPLISAGDRRMCGTISIDTLHPEDSHIIDIALVSSFMDSTAPPLSEITKLKQDIRSVQRLYDHGLTFHSSSTTSAVRDIDAGRVVIYPNPATGTLYVSKVNSDATYSITDITGRSCTATMTGNQLDISSLSSGMYVLHISDKNGSSAHRFIKE